MQFPIMKLKPEDCYPPHKVSRPDQVIDLANSFLERGWDGPKLVGYPLGDKIQLLSGSHRYEAAKLVGIDLPVVVVPYEVIGEIWGMDEWSKLMKLGEKEGIDNSLEIGYIQ
jgi:ParB-like chromosome segregation protein Spo0J